MNKFLKLGIMTILASVILIMLLSGAVLAAESAGPVGPAPNSGDGVSDGSGLESPSGPNSESVFDSISKGPAPNSGDCIPDGSGF